MKQQVHSLVHSSPAFESVIRAHAYARSLIAQAKARQREQAREAALEARRQAAALALVPIDPNVAAAAREAEEAAEELEKQAMEIKRKLFSGHIGALFGGGKAKT